MKSFAINSWTIIPPLIAIGLANRINVKYGLGISASIFNAETSIIYWTGIVGTPLIIAILIAIICGNYDLFMWFWAANHSGWVARFLLKKFRGLDESRFKIWRWLGKIFDFLERIIIGWIHSDSYQKIRSKDATYSVLRVLGAIPGLIWVGVAMSKFLNLDQKRAYLSMAQGNTVKMIFVGFSGWTLWTLSRAMF
ncbi:MAG: hypothetical protein KGJ89_04425 [Patescibacteria group bacterium]|nr:hypothetical protein [Patescibacteria group bacterium]MDE2015797.1 hypothetical protein [Patescibacteria group bacterium]MDE2227172.1 hypothetical protein [Patescibacteria group bacterium]